MRRGLTVRAVLAIRELTDQTILETGDLEIMVAQMTSHERFKRMFEHRQADRVPIVHMPPAIVTHAGPGVVGVSFFVAP